MINFLNIKKFRVFKKYYNKQQNLIGEVIMAKNITYQVIYSAKAAGQYGSGTVQLDNGKTVTYTTLCPSGTDWRKNYHFDDAKMIGLSSNIGNCQIKQQP